MKYLESFLAQHGAAPLAPECGILQVTEGTKARSVLSVADHPSRAACTDGTSAAFVAPTRQRLARTGLAVREVLGFLANRLVGLPIAPVLVLALPDLESTIYVDLTAQPRPGSFAAREWLAMARAAESERARPADLYGWVARKRERPGWCLTADEASAGRINGIGSTWTVQRVLDQLGAELRAVAIEGGGS